MATRANPRLSGGGGRFARSRTCCAASCAPTRGAPATRRRGAAARLTVPDQVACAGALAPAPEDERPLAA
ncbi:hypothetical protein GCM10023195_54780 [Actinoallomurus liliacearum]|uniref:Uncharacterized protein n=1 Tax=Actinoallomurus liliacearum TaxID=1080073 RepID=A0ABP8TRY7_9ACTN